MVLVCTGTAPLALLVRNPGVLGAWGLRDRS